jgi:ubiquinone/menaquinone biosynthesis C-methylase UbiE
MSKSQKELAYLKDLYISGEWTERFTNLVDKHLKFPKEGKFLYYNAGTGGHLLAVREKLEKDVDLIAVNEDAETQIIAEAKADAMKVKINFAKFDQLKSEDFDYVLADLSFVPAEKLSEILDEIVFLTKKKGNIAFFVPTAGSFGEIYSYLWETFLNVDLLEKSGEIERLINRIPTVSQIEEMAKEAGLKKIEAETSREVFEYDKSKDFIDSALANDFLIPNWLDFLSDKEKKKALTQLEKVVDADLEGLSFRFSVKATLVEGEKA